MKAEEFIESYILPPLTEEEIDSIEKIANQTKNQPNPYFKSCSKLSRFEDGRLVTYTCQQVKLFRTSWLIKFRKVNCSDVVKQDRYYEEYRKQIDFFLSKCTCNELFEEEVEKILKEKQEAPEKPFRKRFHNWIKNGD